VETYPFEIIVFANTTGKEPFVDWLKSCDSTTRAVVFSRLDRVEQGNIGDHKSVGENLFELRIHSGAGYRIYFGKIEKTIILLLTGGKKSSQKKDIEKARKYWSEFQGREVE